MTMSPICLIDIAEIRTRSTELRNGRRASRRACL